MSETPFLDYLHKYPADAHTWFDRWRKHMGPSEEQTPHENLANPPADPLEQELTAIRTSYRLLKALPASARIRALRYIHEVLGETE